MTDNHYHTYGQSDLSISETVTKTYTLRTTAEGANPASTFGISIGYGYESSSGSTITSSINPNSSSGYYTYAIKYKIKDFYTDTDRWWKFLGYTTNYDYFATKLDDKYGSAKYYQWLKSDLVGTKSYVF